MSKFSSIIINSLLPSQWSKALMKSSVKTEKLNNVIFRIFIDREPSTDELNKINRFLLDNSFPECEAGKQANNEYYLQFEFSQNFHLFFELTGDAENEIEKNEVYTLEDVISFLIELSDNGTPVYRLTYNKWMKLYGFLSKLEFKIEFN